MFSRVPQTQARSCSTFSAPPLDGTLTLPELFEWQSRHSPNHRIFTFSREDGTIGNIYWPEAIRAVHTGARIIQDRLGAKRESKDAPVVAILAHSDAIPYLTKQIAILRANCVAFPISPRNSPAATTHLLVTAKVRHILVGREQAMLDLAHSALKVLESQHPSDPLPQLSSMPLFEDLYLRGDDLADLVERSTAFPKPIHVTHRRFFELGLIPWFSEHDLTDKVLSLHAMPMYHGMGTMQASWTASCGLVLSVFEPKSPTPIPTPDLVLLNAKATRSDLVFCVPAFIEAWSRSPEYVTWLASRQGVLYGGGPLGKETGDYLTSKGVSIYILYGSTEAGVMSPIIPAHVDYDWDYFRFREYMKTEMVPYGDNTFGLVIIASEFNKPSVLNTVVSGVKAYATSDLLAPHPTKAGFWRVYGRTDDQIMHSTGEKTNPGPLESILYQDPHVQSCVMFGRGRFQAGVLIDVKPQFKFDPSDEVALAAFRNAIMSTVERMNEYAPQHSRIFKEIIIVSKPSKPFTYTAKGTPRRHAVIKDYDEEIHELYKLIDQSTLSNIPAPPEWDIVDITDFVRAVIAKVMTHDVGDHDDLFEHGCDSLQATWIRNSLLRAVRNSAELETRKSAKTFVYEHPTIASLAAFISSVASGIENGKEISQQARVDAMNAMISTHTKAFPAHKESLRSALSSLDGDVVVLTGTTGSLGCRVLAELASDTTVARVYALNRSSSSEQTLSERQKLAMATHGLDAGLLQGGKVILLESDVASTNLGLPEDVYEEVTWPVDFNLSLASFEKSVKGLRSLIDFALGSPQATPPKLLFMSSISVFRNLPGGDVQSESHIEPTIAAGTGYSESKWVAEEILCRASAATTLMSVIVRIGQICGGPDGAWNAGEWFPSLMKSAQKLGCLPDDQRTVDWIPIDIAATAVIQFRGVSRTCSVHLVHPRPVSWSSIAAVIASDLSAKLVSYKEWLTALEQARSGIPFAPSRLPFFQSVLKAPGAHALGFPVLETTHATSSAAILRDPGLRQLRSGDAKSWLAYWREVELLSMPA
ncbi:acetyl-CoA synthetase-like protein [Laetiporus sulphureus 93-53]|uniref:Acetyl-CoA synthetase-like protein n=1 Tax=Laetiporus sulphureus 93-53 TaxID=1314785 RepID=A0A165BMZ3_9APHY|nr:acetyl-CoA synthetase-like protein [Laetiporus sulphureus 93-53]KZT01334.1 acetyl-CoA synthetase-like protein [Laetiporus sulphureus 93-53]